MALNSTSTIKILDLLCEGPIDGIEGAEAGVYLDETPLVSAGNRNYPQQDVNYEFREGTATQDAPSTAPGVTSTVTDINTQIGANYSEDLNADNLVINRNYGGGQLVRQITDTDTNSFRILFTIPKLFSVAKEGLAQGQLFSATIGIVIQVQSRGSGYNTVYTRRITGTSTTNYQFTTPSINLDGVGPWNIKVIKEDLGEDGFEVKYANFRDNPQNISIANDRGNEIYWTSLIEQQNIRTGYPYSAVVGLSVSTRQFNSLPTRAYLIRGRKVMVPSNATVRPDGSLQFDGAFDGSLRGPVWTTCPVCCFYDMLTNPRYGAGDFITAANLSWTDLYPLARYANQLVLTPADTQEPRFACNVLISDQAEAYNVLQDLASVFRGLLYWSADVVQAAADHGNIDGTNISPAHVYTNANVIDGVFEYSGSSLKSRATSIRVRYNDPQNFYKSNYVVVENSDLISKYGYQIREIVAFGATSKWQAQRVGQWILKTEELKGDTVTFTTGLAGAVVLPGQVFAVADRLRQGTRVAGRISSATTTAITCDQTITLPAGSGHEITCILPSGTVETRTITSVAGAVVNVGTAFTTAPQAQAIYSISSSSLKEQKFRCISVADNGDAQFSITGVVHNDSIYNAVDTGTNLTFNDVTSYDTNPDPVANLTLTNTQIVVNNNKANRLSAAWSRATDGQAFGFEIRYKTGEGNYITGELTEASYFVDYLPPSTAVTFEVRAIGQAPLKRKSIWSTATITTPADGTSIYDPTLPPDPSNVTIEAFGNDQVLLRWNKPVAPNSFELIAIIRHSNKTDGTGEWAGSTLVSQSITANTAQAILPLIEGEYLIKFEDRSGRRSNNAVSATIDLPNPIPRYSITTVREDTTTPPFQGQVDGAFYSDEYDGLVLDGDATIDDVVDIDALTSFDFSGTRGTAGRYYFRNILDIGGNYSVVFNRILATTGLYPADTIDDRTNEIDRWSDFDGLIPDDTSADIYFRTSAAATVDEFMLLEDGSKLLLEDGDDFELESDIDFGDWIPLRAGRYTGRQFQFKCELTTSANDQTPVVTELGYVMQLESRTERSATLTTTAASFAVTYAKPFYETPALGVTAFNLGTGDYYEITSPSRTGFTVTFKNSGGTAVSRQFQYVASGYGTEEI